MKNLKKRGFTIVELVIVIAVIAILAAVLIPTFSSILAKANLSADKQAVRSMNEALAQWEASTGYSKPGDVDTVMQQLANAGYNTENWSCLTEGYQVYWFKNDNRMILYNAKTAQIEYPEEYVGTKTMVTAENNFFIYNYNHVKAQQFDMSISSHISADTNITGSSSLSSVTSVTTKDSGIKSNESNNLTALQSAISSNSQISNSLKSAAGGDSSSSLYYYATREVVSASSANAYASLQVAAVGTEANPVKFASTGVLEENLYYLTVVNEGSATTEQIKAAQKAAGEYVYNIFDQMTTGKINSTATVVVEAGTVLDCSTCEWAPCKTFCGYFGTTDADNPVIINGARLTSATGHSSTVAFNGSGSKYFVTGFFGTIYGETTIENVKFQNITITNPASDYELTTADVDGKLTQTRNTVSIIGGITDAYSESNSLGTKANVTLKNIQVEDSCTVQGSGCVGGLVGYIGSAKSTGMNLNGTVTIEGCQIHTNVVSTDNYSIAGYRAIGGVFGFCCRVDTGLTININNTVFDGTLNGYGYIGVIAGATQNNYNINVSGGDYSNAKIATDASKTPWKTASGFGYVQNPSTITISTSKLVSGIAVAHNSDITAGKNVDYVLDGTKLK